MFIVTKSSLFVQHLQEPGKVRINQSSEHVVVGPMMEKLSAAANTSVPGARFWDQVKISALYGLPDPDL
jgi:hypothetical protein